ncbi:MAG: 50S ribosomal protein L6 [Deltaproteobacteria bacterium]|nr:50S ribosomal protein L6 [Deltaproteobacteria bacterium]MBW2212308.1 50S ribosomal protein L6 [Deltaproteobacteria bacterium]MBW2214323.1 50S ribosomal protein L6 [Deltaproteobacteria bacterium]MBW2381802.1 50S ribosomal protein L6 [Deltaproteobacteria bacterium]MBW2628050.1 50S ribosomal protein L6 [Deltaproteobacteria bacterium]
MTETHTGKQSRNGKKPVEVAKGVQISISGQDITVKGPKGELTYAVRPEVVITQGDGVLTVSPAEGAGKAGLQYQGLTRALLRNMVEGVATGYKRSLDFRGVGYRAEFKNNQLKMTVGLSHQPILDIPKVVGIKVETIDEAGTKFPRVHLESPDKEVIGRVAARIRQMRPPEPYNGKGVRYTGERIREKAGKAGKAGG